MANNNIEIEIQANVEYIEPLMKFLEEKADFKSERYQLDEYYTPSDKDFTATRPVLKWLRLRDAAGKYSINYKNWHLDKEGKTNHCDEYETKIDDINTLRNIFLAIGFKQIVKVEKVRKDWHFEDYGISIDSVKGLGDFVEIEYIGDDNDADPKKVTDSMIEFLKNLGCGKVIRNYQGYPFLLLFPEEAKYEEV